MKDYLRAELTSALQTLAYPVVDLIFDKPKVAAHGDLTTNVAMMLAKQVGKNPREVAKSILDTLKLDAARISAVEIAGPGFINFRFSDTAVFGTAKAILLEGPSFGRSAFGAKRKTNIEWVSANPTGPLHAGHGRQVILGAAMANILEWTGFDVTREYYFNNAGNQMRNLGESVYARYCQELGEDYPMPENGYQGDYIRNIAKRIVEEFGAAKKTTDEDKDFFRKRGEEWCFEAIKKTLAKLGVKHDVFYNEDSLYKTGKITEVVEEFKKRDLAYEAEGAVWFRATALGLDADRVIVKSSGEPTYRLPDIAYHREKFRRGFELVIDIFGADHIATIPDVLAGVRALGYSTDSVKVIIHQMVAFVRGGQLVKMSKREANGYTLDDLIEEVGVDAVHYFFVMRGANTQLDFDIDLAKQQSDSNPVYYLQYAHARIASILRFAAEEGYDLSDPKKFAESTDLTLLSSREELELLKLLAGFPAALRNCAESYEPHRLTLYLREVSEAFHRFYHEHRVISDDKPLMQARVALCHMAKTVIGNGCTVLNVHAPEKM